MNKLIKVPYESYFASTEELLMNIYVKDKLSKVCYISLNKTYSFLSSSLSALPFDRNRLFVIDAATKTSDPDDEVKDNKECTYIRPKNLIKDLISLQNKFIGNGAFNYIFLDSLSTLLIYHTEKEVMDYCVRLANETCTHSLYIYLLCNKTTFPSISKNLEERGISIIQQTEYEYDVIFKLEGLLDICRKMETAIANNKKNTAKNLYKIASTLFNKLKTGDIDGTTRKELYERSIKCYNKLKSLK